MMSRTASWPSSIKLMNDQMENLPDEVHHCIANQIRIPDHWHCTSEAGQAAWGDTAVGGE